MRECSGVVGLSVCVRLLSLLIVLTLIAHPVFSSPRKETTDSCGEGDNHWHDQCRGSPGDLQHFRAFVCLQRYKGGGGSKQTVLVFKTGFSQANSMLPRGRWTQCCTDSHVNHVDSYPVFITFVEFSRKSIGLTLHMTVHCFSWRNSRFITLLIPNTNFITLI